MGQSILLGACRCTFALDCADEPTASLIQSVFSGLSAAHQAPSRPLCRYRIERNPGGAGFRFSDGAGAIVLENEDSLLFHIDQALVVAHQHARRDLFFLHAAAVALDGRVAVLAAASGTGKSSFTAVALRSGFEYLSDELAPIDVARATVEPYPHALCLKSPLPEPYYPPPGMQQVGRRFHLPPSVLPRVHYTGELPVAALIFLERGSGDGSADLRPISTGTAAARLMSHGLNLLAHPGDGLDAAIALSESVPCRLLDISNLGRAVAAVESALAGSSVWS